MCGGAVGTTYACTVTLTGNTNNDYVYANVAFADATGTPTIYSEDARTVTLTTVSKAPPAPPTAVILPGGQHTSSASAWAQKNGSNSAKITATITENGVTWTAVITFN